MLHELIKLVQNVGFPIAVSCYLLIRMEGKIDKLTKSIDMLTLSIKKM